MQRSAFLVVEVVPIFGDFERHNAALRQVRRLIERESAVFHLSDVHAVHLIACRVGSHAVGGRDALRGESVGLSGAGLPEGTEAAPKGAYGVTGLPTFLQYQS